MIPLKSLKMKKFNSFLNYKKKLNLKEDKVDNYRYYITKTLIEKYKLNKVFLL